MTTYHVRASNTELWVTDATITFTPQDDAGTLSGAYAIAGLVDCHSHSTFDLSDRDLQPGAAETVAANMRDYFAAGVTAIRDAGGVSMAAVEARDPRIVAAGRFLAPPGRYFTDWTLPTEADGLVVAATAQVAAGATWVKVVDDWFSPDSGRVEQHYDASTLTDVVHAVHAAGARVHRGHFADTDTYPRSGPVVAIPPPGGQPRRADGAVVNTPRAVSGRTVQSP